MEALFRRIQSRRRWRAAAMGTIATALVSGSSTKGDEVVEAELASDRPLAFMATCERGYDPNQAQNRVEQARLPG